MSLEDARGSKRRPGSRPASEAQIARKLGLLAEQQHSLVRDLIVIRGGTGANVQSAGPWADRTLRQTAEAALSGSKEAEKAVKIVKQAKRLGELY